MVWQNQSDIGSRSYTCGHCGNLIASAVGFKHQNHAGRRVHLCPHCDQPTYWDVDRQIPGVAPGAEVKAVPTDVSALYKEARNSVAISAYTGAVLLCRKILMNVAVAQGANPGLSFLDYVQYLADKGYVPPQGKGWVDHIRKKGNEATHEIRAMSKDDSEELILFVEMLLKFIYEFPSKIPTA
jgi:hypothetical protein